jgi:hypothetical protein
MGISVIRHVAMRHTRPTLLAFVCLATVGTTAFSPEYPCEAEPETPTTISKCVVQIRVVIENQIEDLAELLGSPEESRLSARHDDWLEATALACRIEGRRSSDEAGESRCLLDASEIFYLMQEREIAKAERELDDRVRHGTRRITNP